MGGSPNYNYPAQPSYGDSMREALESQVALLAGSKVGKADFTGIRDELGLQQGDNLMQELVSRYEAPLRKTTAQIDTDVLRQTILGGEGKTTDQEGRVITGYTTPEPAGGEAGLGGYQIVNLGWSEFVGQDGQKRPKYGLVDKDGKTVLTAEDDPAEFGMGGIRKFDKGVKTGSGVASLMAQAKKDGLLTPQQAEAGKKAEPIYETDPETGEPRIYKDDDGNVLSGQKTARPGDGMVDLLGDTRGVRQAVGSEDYEGYVRSDDARMEAWKVENARLAGLGEAPRSIEEWGQAHYEQAGKAAGDEMPTSYSLQDAGRQAGFDESGKFLGLSALAEDIGRGGQQRAREADISDVERLGGRATDAYRAQGDLGGALAQARGIGAGGAQRLSAIPKDPLFEGAALDSLAARTAAENKGIDAITSEGMAATMARSPNALRAATDYRPTADIAGGEIGADALRTALMSDAETSLAGGLTGREERQISEAMKAQSTMMGRTFDQSAGLAEAKARLLEDRNRQALNRQYAQQVLGQEAGLQQSDLGRGLQASLANQQAANRAAEFGVGSGMQQEQAQAQLDQQTVLANQAARQDAARYSAQEEMQAKQMELGRQTAGVERQLTAEEKDIERIMRQQAMEEQYRQQGLGAERASAAQMVGLEQATSADPFQAILQRQGQNNLASGGALFGQAGYGLDSGPQYLNPEAGLGFISNQATNAANMFGAQSMADATTSGGIMGGLGSLAGGLLGNPNLFKKCWVAREVYGEHNPAWLLFRNWLDTDAPRWFDKLYLAFGERFANFISNKPRLKARIRLWMDSKIGR